MDFNICWTENKNSFDERISLAGLRVSVLGHDFEVKAYYEKQITAENPPSCFLDIGANYGTHSLLFLKSDIKTISIEPNPLCWPYFKKITAFNQVSGDWHSIVLGDKLGEAVIKFPENETWLGTLKSKSKLKNQDNLKAAQVSIETLDRIIPSLGITPDMIKIDTEGYEEEIIKGGKDVFKMLNSEVIFEANTSSEQNRLLEIFQSINFEIYSMKTNKKIKGQSDIV